MKSSRVLLLGLLLVSSVASATPWPAPSAPAAVEQAEPVVSPAEQNRRVIAALLKSNYADLLAATEGEDQLEAFLSAGRGAEGEAEVRARLAEEAKRGGSNEGEREAARLFSDEPIDQLVADWYPLWQKQLPQAMAGLQMGMVAMSSAIGESTDMSPLERSQLTELHWAINGWIARTDFADPKKFAAVVREGRALARASGVEHFELLEFTTPQKRLDLMNQTLAAVKRVVKLYGIDADEILKSARVVELSRDADSSTIRTTASVLGVEVSLEQKLHLRNGKWLDEGELAMIEMTEQAEAEHRQAVEAADAGWPQDEVLAEPEPAPAEKANIGEIGGCRAPT